MAPSASYGSKTSLVLCVVLVALVAVAAISALLQLQLSLLDVEPPPVAIATLLLRATAAALWCGTLYCSYSHSG